MPPGTSNTGRVRPELTSYSPSEALSSVTHAMSPFATFPTDGGRAAPSSPVGVRAPVGARTGMPVITSAIAGQAYSTGGGDAVRLAPRADAAVPRDATKTTATMAMALRQRRRCLLPLALAVSCLPMPITCPPIDRSQHRRSA
jgi:hypothetical protein